MNKIEGTVHFVRSEEINTKNGAMLKHELVVKTEGQYPKTVCFEVWGDKMPNLGKGNSVTVFFDLESREYNQKFYTSAKAWKIEVGQSNTPSPSEESELPF